jgi:hypothetical protein
LNELLPFYVGGTLEESRRLELEHHLAQCAICGADLVAWQAIASDIQTVDRKIVAGRGIAEDVLKQIARSAGKASPLQRVIQIIQSQIPLVQREIWLASALVMAIGLVVAVIAEKAIVIHVLAPMVATVCVVVIYGSENDPAFELANATPTSQWQILFARLALVFSYNLILALAASLGFAWLVPGELVGNLVLGWLGPMAFMSILALAVSLWTSPANAITAAYSLWLLQIIAKNLLGNTAAAYYQQPALRWMMEAYLDFWSNPGLLLITAGLICIAVLSLVSRSAPRLHKA